MVCAFPIRAEDTLFMLTITALPAFNDNYIWLLQNPATLACAVVDPGDAAPVLQWLQQNPQWTLTDILVTHHHRDHTGGIAALKPATGRRAMFPAAGTAGTLPACARPYAGPCRLLHGRRAARAVQR